MNRKIKRIVRSSIRRELKIRAEMNEKELQKLLKNTQYQNLELFTEQELEQRDRYILVNKTAILCRGNFHKLLFDYVRSNTPYGASKINIGQFPYCISTRSKLLMDGYSILFDQTDDSLPYVAPFPSMRQIRVEYVNPDLVEDL